MKRSIFIVLLAVGAGSAKAQFAVVDIANVAQSAMNYAKLVEQLSQQATQISNQVQQIRQFETQLGRIGDMATIKSIVGFSQYRSDLDLSSKVRTWADGVSRSDGRGLFGDTRGGLVRAVTASFDDFDGVPIDRDESVYKNDHNTIVTVDEFKSVQSDVYARREALKRAIGATSDALQAANTEAEEQKLAAVLSAQYQQLAVVDADVALSAAQVQVKVAESSAISSAKENAEAEARARLSQSETAKISKTYKPTYECLLQYLTETKREE